MRKPDTFSYNGRLLPASVRSLLPWSWQAGVACQAHRLTKYGIASSSARCMVEPDSGVYGFNFKRRRSKTAGLSIRWKISTASVLAVVSVPAIWSKFASAERRAGAFSLGGRLLWTISWKMVRCEAFSVEPSATRASWINPRKKARFLGISAAAGLIFSTTLIGSVTSTILEIHAKCLPKGPNWLNLLYASSSLPAQSACCSFRTSFPYA